jgi:hypothetical protein
LEDGGDLQENTFSSASTNTDPDILVFYGSKYPEGLSN